MFQAIAWGALLRFLQAATQAAPTLLAGLLVASVFRRLLGPERTVRLFGGRGFRALPQAWVLGMLLPVCSLGVIPVIREMRRAGVSGGAILAFALAAPLFNPLSLLYGLTLSAPLHIFSFAACSLIVVTIVGATWDRWYPEQVLPAPPAPPATHGVKRLIAMAVIAAREIAGGSLGYVAIGLAGVAALAVVLPPGALQTSMNHDNPWAPLVMTAVAIPAYVTPMMAMSQLGSMFQHGNSVGAAFVLLAIGAGANAALLAFMLRNYGLRRSLVWLTLITTTVLGLAYLVDKPLFPRGTTPEQHTHVFDVYCRPFHPGQATVKEVWRELSAGILPFEMIGSLLVSVLLATGLILRLGAHRWQIDHWLESSPAPPVAQTWYNRPLRAPELAAAVLLGLIVFSIVGCFLYYPPAHETFEDMRIARTEAISAAISGEEELAEHWIDICDNWARRLEVGMYLRRGGLNDAQVSSARLFRGELELLEHAVDEADRAAIRLQATKVENAYQALRTAYLSTEIARRP
jgi:uncharacterized membrane protein YraQ (UPF0718 family)